MSQALPLNLLHLAKAEPGAAKHALVKDFWIQALITPQKLSAVAWWLLVLEGELIVDLPHGDFRVLKVGDSLELRAEEATLTPLQQAVFLFSELAG